TTGGTTTVQTTPTQAGTTTPTPPTTKIGISNVKTTPAVLTQGKPVEINWNDATKNDTYNLYF
ncbi:hypothetical protein COU88_04205, partial [Candidatus Roizmanbacteria bacterium CG10_big_fil_rev_8_21_14_0_10_39_6]